MKRLILFLTLVLGLAAPALAQKHYTELEYPPLPDFEIPEATQVELPNGMIVFLIEDHELPVINASARIGAGSVWEPADKVGLASITGTVMRTGGTTSVSGDELNQRLENIGAVIETSIGETSGSATLFTLKEHTDEVLPLFADVLMHPAFPEDKLDLAKTQQKSAISRRNDDPQSIAFREFGELIYGSESPYARSPEYFTVDAIERDDLVAFHEQFFHPNNVILGVWGDFDTEAMVAKLEAAFADWPRNEGFARPEPPPITADAEQGVYYVDKPDVTQSTILLGHPGEVTRRDPDYFPLTVMNEVLSGGFSSRLFQNVRDDQGLAYAVFGGYTAGYDRPGQFYAGVMTKSETTVEAAESVLNEVRKMQEAPPSTEEMMQAKDSYLNSFVFNFDTRQEIVNRMMTYEYYDYPQDFLQQEQAAIEAVNGGDVLRVAKTYLKPDQVEILAVGNDDAFGEPLSALELGAVQEIDIAIPTSAEAPPEATEETLAGGRELLNAAIDALGGQAAFDAIETMRVDASSSVTTPDNQQMSIGLEALYVYPDKARFTQTMPMGTFTITKNGEAWTFPPQLPEQMQGAIKQQLTSALWRDLAYLFAHADQIEVQALGQEDVQGQTTETLQVTPPGGADAFKLHLDPSTRRPVAISYQAAGMGPPTPTVEVISDFRDVAGVQLPFQSTSYANGETSAETTIEALEVNVEVDPGTFE